ncbi:lysophospholipase catalytic domain-containing protein [Aspergillus caelatus]|uniref:Lysophospholipase n=2 Tax=Aspergillus subgen. Circumdati TaxID=2720871 RepID=A0A5N7AL68_9EURO|nr:lysophospholipase catalytic domain-containing protein [Aspergillus caelatus]KAE8370632.1 lysophospholipase catalytic domain-containing protein [Aspergillus caelatus]
MKVALLTLAAGLANAASLAVTPRAFPNAPNEYAPANVSCPSTRPSIRSAAALSTNEKDWLQVRRNETLQPMKDLLGRLNLTSFDASGYIDRHKNNASNIPNVAIAVSGGGYRALTNGAGAIKAFDSRTSNSTARGQLGGLLQSSTYLSGLSGGGWLVGSVYINNFTTISDLQASEKVWDFKNSILEGPDVKHFQLINTAAYWKDLYDAVKDKREAGFNTSLTDYWGRALSYQFINATTDDGGSNYTWSSIALTDDFKKGKMPMPILVADGRNPGEILIGSNSTVYEFNPWEFGSFDPSVYGFAPLEYVGSNFENGELPKGESCVRGFDNAGFVMGTSSSLFNQFILRLNGTDIPNFLKEAIADVLEHLGEKDEDIAVYAPNPFYKYRNSTAAYSSTPELDVVDGGEDGQNIPLHPLIQPSRNVDVIFAVDSSADTDYSWPNGSSLIYTYERSLNTTGIANGTSFPAVPDVNTFLNLGLNKRPTFFGCNSSNTSTPTPLIVYLPNAPYTAESNTSTFQLAYKDQQRDDIILNGYNVVTQGNASTDANWPSCVGCAILQRSTERTNTKLPDICNTCFQNYCWDGKTNTTTPSAYEPEILMEASTSGASKDQLNRTAAVIAFAVMFFMTI